MMRTLLLFIAGIVTATAIAALVPTAASAVQKQYYWDGNEKIVIKHPYFTKTNECRAIKSQDPNGKCNGSAVFVLDRNTRDDFRFKATGMNDTISASDGSKCTFLAYYIDVTFTSDGKATSEGVRGERGDDGATVQGGNFTGANNEACQQVFDGSADNEGLSGGLEIDIRNARDDLNKPFTISGAHGRDAVLSALEDQLDRMKEREKKHFIHRVCSTHPEVGTPGFNEADSNCDADEAGKAYDMIWKYCVYEARGLTKEDAKIAEVKACLQEQSGVLVNGALLDDVAYNIVSYVDGESCSIKFIGWIVCPLSRFLAKVTDAAFDGLSQFLIIRPLNKGSKAGDALFSAWSLVNNVANVLFIIAFLMIIFAQTTGLGMSNYSIKRLLPRLIITAILVNVSYYICVVAVDTSNLIGVSLMDIISSLEPDAVNKPSTWTTEVENILVFTAGAAGVGFILLTGSLVAMFPLLVGAALSFLVAILMIVARYALVVILIIAAPLAIAMSLLPNTQKWYSQWQKLFVSMLMLFPMIAIVFGMSKVAGILVLNSSLSRSTGDITLQLFGLAIMALPLALTPVLMRLSGGILNRFGGSVAGNGLFKKAKDGAQGVADRKRDARDVKGLNRFGDNRRKGLAGARDKMIQRRYRRSALHSLNEQEQNSAYANYISGYTSGKEGVGGDETSRTEKSKEWLAGKLGKDYDPKTKGEKFAENLAKGGGSLAQVQADAINAQLSINAKEVKAAKVRLENEQSMDMGKLRDLATNESTPEAIRQAAIEMVTTSGSVDDINAVVKSSGSMNKTQRQVLVKGVSSSRVSGAAAYYSSPGAQQAILSGSVNSDASFTEHVVSNWLNSGEVSANNVGTMHGGGLAEVGKALDSNHVDNNTVASVSAAAKQAKSSSSIQSQAHGTQEANDALDAISRLR